MEQMWPDGLDDKPVSFIILYFVMIMIVNLD